MRREHLFCAEVFHRVHGLIDHGMRKLFCLDGGAAKEGARRGEIECETMPDFCFTFAGAEHEIRIEGKILTRRRIKRSPNERPAWCRNGQAPAPPVDRN